MVCHNSRSKAWDDVTNVERDVDNVRAARDLDMQSYEAFRAYDRVDLSEIKRTWGELIGTRWVDVNKGDSLHCDRRSRLVGR